MSIRSLESGICCEARRVFKNPKLRVKDMAKWSTSVITPEAGEVVEKMPTNGVWVAIKAEFDKRT